MPRKKHNIHYIYKTTCNVTGRWYVGMHSTINLEDGYMGSGKLLRYSIRKYGKNNHTKEILEYLPSRESLVLREIEIVTKELISDVKCMNLKEGGCDGGQAFANRLKNDDEFYKHHLKTWSERLKNAHSLGKYRYDTFTGRKHTEETKKLMSESSKGKGVGNENSQFNTCWIFKDGINKKIKKEELEIYLLEGWIKGRKMY